MRKKKKDFQQILSDIDWDADKEKQISLPLVIVGKVLHVSVVLGLLLTARYAGLGEWFLPLFLIVIVVFVPFILLE